MELEMDGNIHRFVSTRIDLDCLNIDCNGNFVMPRM